MTGQTPAHKAARARKRPRRIESRGPGRMMHAPAILLEARHMSTSPLPISLTDGEITVIMQCSRPLQPDERSRFIEAGCEPAASLQGDRRRRGVARMRRGTAPAFPAASSVTQRDGAQLEVSLDAARLGLLPGRAKLRHRLFARRGAVRRSR